MKKIISIIPGEENLIAGVDEVGRGCLAGPVVSAALIIDFSKWEQLSSDEKILIQDSKKLTLEKRLRAKKIIEKIQLTSALGMATVDEIDELNILQASFLAMRRALEKLSLKPKEVWVDGHLKIPLLNISQKPIVKGDQTSLSIAGASILAKVFRDAWMIDLSEKYPQYHFYQHVGYGTKKHLNVIKEIGICPEHRKSFGLCSSFRLN